MANVVDPLNTPHIFRKFRAISRGLRLLPLAVAVMLPLLSSCHRENATDRQLAEIEERMESDTTDFDSIVTWLSAIPDSTIDTPYRKALYDCLMARARYFSGSRVLDDSLVSIAIDVFKEKNDLPHLTKALITRGYLSLGRYEHVMCMADAIDGLDLARSIDDTLSMARAEELMALNFGAAYRRDSALVHYWKSAELYSSIGRQSQATNEYMNTAVYLAEVGRLDEAITMLDSIRRETAPDDSIRQTGIYNKLMWFYTNAGRFADAETAFRQSLSYMNGKMYKSFDWRNVIEMYYAASKPDSVQKYLEVLKDHYYGGDGNWHYYAYNKLLAAERGDYEEAYCYYLAADSIMSCRSYRAHTCEPLVAVNEYHNARNIELAAKIEHRNTVIMVVVISSLVIIALVVVMYVTYRRRQREKNMMMLMEIADLKEQLDSKKIDTDLAEVLFKSGFESLDVLTSEYFRSLNTGRGLSESIYKNLDKQLDKLRSDEALDRLSEQVDLLYGGILSKLAEIPSIKKNDIHFIALKLAGFSSKSICLFLNLSPTNYYTKWQRIRNRVGEASIVLPV